MAGSGEAARDALEVEPPAAGGQLDTDASGREHTLTRAEEQELSENHHERRPPAHRFLPPFLCGDGTATFTVNWRMSR